MRRALVAAALLLAASSANAAENRSDVGIFAETRSQKMVGMPAMPELPPGMDPAILQNMPGMANMLAMMRPQRMLSIRLWSPGIAPETATASMAPPAGMKLGDRLDLGLYRPSAETGQAAAPGEFNPDAIPEFTIKIYWGSSAKVKPGQPKVIRWGDLPPEQKALMREEARKAQKQESYFYKPDWTTGYWPTGKQPGAIAPDASLRGTWSLTTNYAGSTSLDADVDFLDAINLTSPKFEKAPPLDKALRLAWPAIPRVLGIHASIMGMQGENTLILWTSSEIPDTLATQWDYLEMAQVRELVQSTAMMAGTRTDVTVPAGIFKDADMAFLTMVGYGPGAARADTQPLPRLQTKTTFTAMLGGKKMPAMGEE